MSSGKSGDVPTAVVCVGLSALDYIWQGDRLPDAELPKVRARGFVSKGGGMAATAAVTIARLGGVARFWGRGGDDAAGRLMRDELGLEGVDCRHFRLFEGASSSVSGVFVDARGERQIANFRGDLPEAADWLPLDELAGVAAVLADPRWPDGAAATFAAARERGIPTVLDAEVADAEVFQRLLPLTDHAVFSAPALANFAGPDVDGALGAVAGKYGCGVSAVTLGERGVHWLEARTAHGLPAFAVEVVDTNGAGDVFHGAYALAIARSMGTAPAMRFASAAAAIKCTKPDGRSGIPTLDEIIDFQRTKP
jgi:sulfofructose kinase